MPTRALCLAAILLLVPASRADDRKAVEFFEGKIRPALEEHCLKCHGADPAKIKGGLDLTTRAGWQAGGDSGVAIEPGKPADSLLVKTLYYSDDLKMPPKGKLPESVVRDFEAWIAAGAADPREAKPGAPAKQVGMSVEAGRDFWAYKLPVDHAPPPVRDAAWPRTPIDRFVLAKLEAAKLAPAPDADLRTLARRISIDLTGLPLPPEEVAAFEQSAIRDPQSAIEQLVDQLLASPAFGERWGRHWLDVARFGESLTLRGIVLPQAWRYRDYVIDRFNDDTPFDQFLREQLAGDLLPAASPERRARQVVASAFLALGNTNLEEQNKQQLRMDVVDEQLDVLTRGVLGQTVTCARCHDHKFDPIPTRDYYALAGVLRNAKAMEHANVSNTVALPLPLPPDEERRVADHEAKVAELKGRVAALRKKGAKLGVVAPADLPGVVVDDDQAKAVGDWKQSTHSGSYIGRGYRHDGRAGKGEKTLTFAPDLPAAGVYEVRLAYSGGTGRPKNVPVTVFSAEGEKDIAVDESVLPPVEGRWVSLGSYRFEKPGQGFVLIETTGTAGPVTADAVQFLPKDAPPVASSAASPLAALEAELKRLEASGPVRPKVVGVVEEKKIEDCPVHVRGLVGTLGDVVPRGVLSVALHGPAPAFPAGESGRRELADWVASSNNPLTARVFVNRAWHWLFGRGIVASVDNFGTTGDRPTHPELLDWLALEFRRSGWSVKKLVRLIVLSRVYRTAGLTTPHAADPENRLLAGFPARPLEAEVLRDTMLLAAGNLSPERGGPGYDKLPTSDYNYRAGPPRRSVYLPAFRNSVPEFLAAFDAADPSLVTGARNRSTVAPQALYLLNHPFPRRQAELTARRLLAEPTDDAARLREQSETAEAGWADVVHALYCTAEFRRHP